jgi:outer membrane protein TolC
MLRPSSAKRGSARTCPFRHDGCFSVKFLTYLRIITIGCSFLPAACASYTALPLPTRPGLADNLSGLRHTGVANGEPLSISAVARLALENNPDLVAIRSQHGVAQAQLLQAGLAPNPTVTGAILPLAAGFGSTQAWNAGISEDIKSLITLSTRRDSARQNAHQVDAQIVWQEWQTIGQARLLAVDIIQGERMLRLAIEIRDLLAERTLRSQQALANGNAIIATVAPDLAALQGAQITVDDAQRQLLSRRHQLNALLGLTPEAVVPLAPSPDLPPLDPRSVMQMLPSLPTRRPDLIALQLGYGAQDSRLRAAILAQFPNLTFGLTGGSDNSNVRNIGPQITLELPIFDRNQGNVAIERATRQQLHDEYAARLTAADGQVRAMLSEVKLLEEQLARSRRHLVDTSRIAAQAEAAFTAGDLDERGYVDLVTARFTKEQEIVNIEQLLLEQRVAIATLIGAGMPQVAIPPAAGLRA